MKNKLKNNIYLDYLFRFFCNFTIVEGMFVLFLGQKGLSLWQIGILEGIFHITGLITEIPSGALADLLGRKQVLLASRICGILSSCIMISTSHFWLLGIGFVFTAWSYNLLSGSEEALLYDSFLGLESEAKYFKTNGRLNFLAEVSQAIAIFLGGFLAKHSYVLCYLVSIALDLLAFLVVCPMMEPQLEKKKETPSVRTHFITSYHLLQRDSRIRYLCVHYAIIFAFYTSVFFYSQEYYFARGFDEIAIGIILLGIGICASLGALLSERITKRLGEHTSYVSVCVLALGMLFMACKMSWISIMGFCVGSMANALLYPIQSNELNMRIPSAQRATVISVSSMCFSMVMIVLFPLIGFLSDFFGLAKIIMLLGVLLLLYNYISLFVNYRKE